MSFNFCIKDWHFWSPNIQTKDAMLESIKNNDLNFGNDISAPTLPYIPAMEKRKFSQLAKMIFEVAYHLIQKEQQIPIFSVCKYGEIQRQSKMTQQIINTGEVSPMLFSYSTFNAAVAQLNIQFKNHKQSIALSSFSNKLETALIQTIAFLKTSKEKEALVFIAQEAIPEEYNSVFNDNDSDVFCFGMIISLEKDSYELIIDNSIKNDSDNRLKDFLKFIITENSSLELNQLKIIKKMEFGAKNEFTQRN